MLARGQEGAEHIRPRLIAGHANVRTALPLAAEPDAAIQKRNVELREVTGAQFQPGA